MKHKETYYNQFLKEKETIVTSLLKDYNEKNEKAQDGYQDNVRNKFLNNLYPLTREKQTELGTINQRFFLDLEETLLEDKHKNIELEFEKKFNLIEGDKVLILKKLTELQAYLEVIQTIRAQGKDVESASELSEGEEVINTPIHWKGKELEFVQLVYSLFEAGYLKNDKEEITNLVKQIAKAFNYRLSESWQSNLSDCVLNRNSDYEPKIFGKLIESFNAYRKERIENHKNISPK